MGYLLKEGLKTLCGVNQWSYAVFWKIGCQNPKLLIWEECYYQPASFSGLPGKEHPDNFHAGDKVHLLVNKMMMDSHVNIVGEGLVGRVAFTGNHQWILSETYCGSSHPPEVVKEVCQQFSAGMQTVAVVPVLPHGVVQFGSRMTVMENLGFINDVISLILQLGCLSGATPGSLDSCSYVHNISRSSLSLVEQIQYELQSNSNSDGMRHQQYHREPRINLPVINGVAKAEVIPSNAELWKNQHTSMYMPKLNSRTVANSGSSYCADDRSVSQPSVEINGLYNGGRSKGYVSVSKWAAGGNTDSKNPTSTEPCNSISVDCFSSDSLLAYTSDGKALHMDNKLGQIELQDCKKERGAQDIPPQFREHLNMVELVPGFVQDDGKQVPYDDVFVQPELGDDLFDILGSDFKNKLLTGCWNGSLSNDQPPKRSLASSELYSAGQAYSESGVFSSAGTDHLLEAVVSRTQPCSKQSMDDNVSCRTTLTNTSSSSVPNTSLSYGRFGASNQLEGEFYLAKTGAMSSSCSLKRSSKEESTSYSQGSSIYGSQISSWMEKDQKAKPSNSMSTSKIPDETGKSNRKRLKPGENPRPRPKDRQMFQDRVKELREIVPNGAKCSLDALLERTIKHMLFLQSVTKHADKLKQTGESKIISKDGGLLLKDNFEGGATWAYEVGSQSMVCPIIVEDLNQPRQMLVQMLCEERGLFLEIVDMIRGLGLTILKGVMETRNNKIWARFAVEANREVTRMEIFISLVRLLEQSSTGVGHENPMDHHRVCSEDYILTGCVKSE